VDLDQAREIIRQDFLDVGDYGLFAGSVSLSAINRFINEAQVEACKRWDILHDTTTEEVCEIALTSGTRAYPLHGKITKVDRVEYYHPDTGKQQELTHLPFKDAERKYGRTSTGTPTVFAIRGRTLYLYPTPGDTEDAGELRLEVWRLPLADLVQDSDEFEVPEQYQQDMLFWAAHRCFHRRDEDLRDTLGTSFYLSQFERVFGPPVSAQTLIDQLENPMMVEFGFKAQITEDDD